LKKRKREENTEDLELTKPFEGHEVSHRDMYKMVQKHFQACFDRGYIMIDNLSEYEPNNLFLGSWGDYTPHSGHDYVFDSVNLIYDGDIFKKLAQVEKNFVRMSIPIIIGRMKETVESVKLIQKLLAICFLAHFEINYSLVRIRLIKYILFVCGQL
jgi:hypothetical protein